jgi:hypothetical protein
VNIKLEIDVIEWNYIKHQNGLVRVSQAGFPSSLQAVVTGMTQCVIALKHPMWPAFNPTRGLEHAS